MVILPVLEKQPAQPRTNNDNKTKMQLSKLQESRGTFRMTLLASTWDRALKQHCQVHLEIGRFMRWAQVLITTYSAILYALPQLQPQMPQVVLWVLADLLIYAILHDWHYKSHNS